MKRKRVDGSVSLHYYHSATRTKLNAKYGSKAFRALCDEAGIEGLNFNDLRGTAVTMLAECACTTPEIASVSGWSIDHCQKIVDTYLSRTQKLAANAMDKMEAEGTAFVARVLNGSLNRF